MQYEIDKFYDFPLVGGTSADEKFFILQATAADGTLGEVTLPKISFQRDPQRPVPSSLTCRVKSFDPTACRSLPMRCHLMYMNFTTSRLSVANQLKPKLLEYRQIRPRNRLRSATVLEFSTVCSTRKV